MAKLGFTKAGAAGFAGQVTGKLMGKLVNNVDAAMEAFAKPESFTSKALEAVKVGVEKVARVATKPFAFEHERFDAPISLKNAFERGFSPETAEGPKPKIKLGFALQPS